MGKFFMRVFTALHGKLVRYTGKLGGGTDDGSILVLRHTGAKSGSERETPVMFMNYNGGYVVCASMAGAPNNPAWYHNLQAHPDVVVTVAKQPIDVHARELTGAERDDVWVRFKASGERWEQYETRTERVLPLIALEPR